MDKLTINSYGCSQRRRQILDGKFKLSISGSYCQCHCIVSWAISCDNSDTGRRKKSQARPSSPSTMYALPSGVSHHAWLVAAMHMVRLQNSYNLRHFIALFSSNFSFWLGELFLLSPSGEVLIPVQSFPSSGHASGSTSELLNANDFSI